MSLAIGASANAAGERAPCGRAEAAHVLDPCLVSGIELTKCSFCGARVADGRTMSRSAGEVGRGRWTESIDKVRQAPSDRGNWLTIVRRICVVHGELAFAERDRRCAFAAAGDRPAAGDRFPEVLVVSKAFEPWPKLVLPMPFKLVHQLGVPVNIHGANLVGQIQEAGLRCHFSVPMKLVWEGP